MIKFITKRKEFHQVLAVEHELVIADEITTDEADFLIGLKTIGFDTETNDLDPYVGSLLLVILGNKETQYVFDVVSYDCSWLFQKFTDDKIYLTVNGKFDYKFIKIKYHKKLRMIYDCMIAEQRLMQGTELSASLQAIQERRLGIYNSKEVRSEFIGVNPQTFIFKNRHISYGADDIVNLFDIRDKQREEINRYNMNFLIYGIEFPLIPVLANCELEGEDINVEKWRENIANNEKKRAESECSLDNEVRNLREKLLTSQERIHLQGGKFDRDRKVLQSIERGNLFGDDFGDVETIAIVKGKAKKKSKRDDLYMNFGSTDFILTLFGRFKQPAPTIDDKKNAGPYLVPKFCIKQTKKGPKEKLDKRAAFPYRFTTGKGSIESYLIENPDVPIKDLVEELIKYRTYCTRLNTFGENFLLQYRNPVTGRYHTVYRQCHAKNGRLQSGDKKNNNYNSHNIPKENEYRNCFHSGTDYLMTTDFSGAEAVIMIDKARDDKFYDIAIKNDDAHSPLATSVWRAIGASRLTNGIQRNNHHKTPLELANIKISKKENKDIRTVFKNTTFSSIYGCGYKKYAKMLNISHDEAKLGLHIMKLSVPKTFKLMEEYEKFAIQNGYILLNTRTNSRVWYLPVFETRKNNSQLSSNFEHEIKQSARNSPISGTQADMIKEVMVEISKEAERQGLGARYNFALLKQVHDETVYRSNNITDLVEFKDDKKGIEMVTIPVFVKKWHIQVANRYLGFITMSAEQEVNTCWCK